jgi:HEAT repeat protein
VSKARSIDAAISALKRLSDDLGSEPSRAELAELLRHRHGFVAAQAAALVQKHALQGFEEALRAVWLRFREGGPSLDPGCRAQEAALTALDHLEAAALDLFLDAVVHVQWEKAAGGPVDTAGGVRQRALFGLFRSRHPDAVLHAGSLLADANPQVRAGAVHALAFYGERQAASLLVHKMKAGDEEPSVVADCASGLLGLAPDFALPILRDWLRESDVSRRECAALALGQSRDGATVAALIEWLESGTDEDDFAFGVRALGAGRNETARDYLLEQVATASAARARYAVEALATHGYDSRLAERVLAAAAQNQRAQLEPLAKRLFRVG